LLPIYDAGYYPRRRGLLDHFKKGRLSLTDDGLHDLLCQLADPETGFVWTNATDLAGRCNYSRKFIQKYLRRLERKGYIKRFAVPRSKKHYPVLVNAFECTRGAHIGKRLNAIKTVNWTAPCYEGGIQSGIQSGSQIGSQKARRSSSL